jgi:hypothetical protein
VLGWRLRKEMNQRQMAIVRCNAAKEVPAARPLARMATDARKAETEPAIAITPGFPLLYEPVASAFLRGRVAVPGVHHKKVPSAHPHAWVVELDRLVAAGTISEIDRKHMRFFVRRIVQPPERPDDYLRENVVGSA